MTDLTVANTILKQLTRGCSLRAMIGTNSVVGTKNSIIFDFKMCRLAQKCVIALNDDDTYTMDFYKIKRVDGVPDAIHVFDYQHIFADNLTKCFESYTGLRLHI